MVAVGDEGGGACLVSLWFPLVAGWCVEECVCGRRCVIAHHLFFSLCKGKEHFYFVVVSSIFLVFTE